MIIYPKTTPYFCPMVRLTRRRLNSYSARKAIHYLRYGRDDLPIGSTYRIVLSYKAIAKVTGLTVPQIVYWLKLHEKELQTNVNIDDVKALK